MSDRWTAWKSFPDDYFGDYIQAPISPGVYEICRASDRQQLAFGCTQNVAQSLSAFLKPGKVRRRFLFLRLRSRYSTGELEYRFWPTASHTDAKVALESIREPLQVGDDSAREHLHEPHRSVARGLQDLGFAVMPAADPRPFVQKLGVDSEQVSQLGQERQRLLRAHVRQQPFGTERSEQLADALAERPFFQRCRARRRIQRGAEGCQSGDGRRMAVDEFSKC